MTNKHGVLKQAYRFMKSLPMLNTRLHWSSYDDPKRIKKHEKTVNDFLNKIKVKKFTRDTIYEALEVGTVVTCNRNSRYIQFLEMDELRIDKQVNGKWIVEYDLNHLNFKSNTPIPHITRAIQSLPDEINLNKVLEYRKKSTDENRFIEIENCDVLGIDSHRNYPYGLPYSFGAWIPLLQKEMINRVERSVSDRLVKQVLILSVGMIGGKDKNTPSKYPPQEVTRQYFQALTQLMQKKDNASQGTNGEVTGTGTISLPDNYKLETLDVDTTMFTKDLYEKIDNDIYSNLGISSALIHGGGSNSNFSTAQVNLDAVMKYIFTILEEIEYIINDYIDKLLPNNISCKFSFDRNTYMDKDKYLGHAKDFYMNTGVIHPWAEALTGVPLDYTLSMARYEKEVLDTQTHLYPPLNPHTMSGNEGAGRPSGDPNSRSSESTQNTNSNSNPSPSD
jgi:hypothetical protein